MANTVKLKRSTSSSATPSASDLEHGELSMNVADGKLFLKKSKNYRNTLCKNHDFCLYLSSFQLNQFYHCYLISLQFFQMY